MHGASFVVRTGARDEPYWHTDYEWWLGENDDEDGPSHVEVPHESIFSNI